MRKNGMSFDELIDALPGSPQEKGFHFELVAKRWLMRDPIWSAKFIPETVDLWADSKFNDGADIGIDLTAETLDGQSWAIQVKLWSSERTLPKSELDKFLSASNTKHFSHRLLITSSKELSQNLWRAVKGQEKPVMIVDRGVLEDFSDWRPLIGDESKPKDTIKKKLRPHQVEAIKEVQKGLQDNDKGQLIMACGTGKTLTAQRIAEAVDGNLVIVFLPSILLVQQCLADWTENADLSFSFSAVCSDSTVDQGPSGSHPERVGIPATTEPEELANFLLSSGRKVIFSTYQSSEVVSSALRQTQMRADFVIYDEAHRLAGNSSKSFRASMDSELMPAEKRLFMTATPRVLSSRVKSTGKTRELDLRSMDDPKLFGQVFFSYAFSHAIEDRVLTDYEVLIFGVTDREVQSQIQNRELFSTGHIISDAEMLAASVGISKAIAQHPIRKMISFHSRRERAEKFLELYKSFSPQLLSAHGLENQHLDYLSGADSAHTRRRSLKKLENLRENFVGLITNSRCLTEGIDVPALDAVAFVDPKQSQVDIIQGVGRAIRRAGETKKKGYVILPIFIDENDIVRDDLADEKFQTVWKVLHALRSHDDTLQESLDRIRTSLGKSKVAASLPDKIVLDMPLNLSQKFIDSVKIKAVRMTSEDWYERYGELLQFVEKNGHTRPTKTDGRPKDEVSLASWLQRQRSLFKKGELDQDKSDLLEQVQGWTWNLNETLFEKNMAKLWDYYRLNGTSRVPASKDAFEVDENGLRTHFGKWVAKQRGNRAKLPKYKIEALEQLPDWTWDPFDDRWNESLEFLRFLAKENGTVARISRETEFPDGRSVGGWIIKQRQVKADLPSEKIEALESLPGWSWDPYDDAKRDTFERLEAYVGQHGHSRVPVKLVLDDGFKLGQRVQNFRQLYSRGELEPKDVQFLESLPGWTGNIRDEEWEAYRAGLIRFVEENKRFPKKEEVFDGLKIGWWLGRHRSMLKKGVLSEFKKAKLDEIPNWEKEAKDLQWMRGYENLVAHQSKHPGLPPKDKEKSDDGMSLGSWVYLQRKNFAKLSAEKKKLLLQFDWFEPFQD